MTRTLVLIPAAVAATALVITPATAKAKRHHGSQFDYYEQHFGSGSSKYLYDDSRFRNWGLTTRNVSDPRNSGIRLRRNSNRCTEAVGYGRYEYCGW